MLQPIRSTVLALTIVGVAATARAEIMDHSASLSPGHVSVGSEMQVWAIDGTPLQLNFHEAIGLAGGLDLTLRQGLGLNQGQEHLFAAGIKWTALSASSKASRPGVVFFFGGHLTTGELKGGDATLIVDYPFRSFRPYVGLDSNLDFVSGDVDFKLGFLGGGAFTINNSLRWFVEGGVGITGTPRPHFVSTGPRFYL